MKCIILDFSTATVHTINLPKGIEQIEDVEEYLTAKLNFKLSQIEFMYGNNIKYKPLEEQNGRNNG